MANGNGTTKQIKLIMSIALAFIIPSAVSYGVVKATVDTLHTEVKEKLDKEIFIMHDINQKDNKKKTDETHDKVISIEAKQIEMNKKLDRLIELNGG